MLTVTGIWIYPIKSLGGIPLTEAGLRPKGIDQDRRWMIVDEQGVCMTQREFTRMSAFAVQRDGEQFIVTFNGDVLNLSPGEADYSKPVDAQVWDDQVRVYEVSAGHSAWLSARLDKTCKLVFFPEDNPRQIDVNYAAQGKHVSLADAFPLLIIGEQSLQDLNTRLPAPITMNRFRPNVVFSGGIPYEEDLWMDFRIGSVRMSGVKRSARCVLTTIDPVTGQKGPEPLRTLARYRKEGNKIFFGQNVIHHEHGTIRLGDTITVERRRHSWVQPAASTADN